MTCEKTVKGLISELCNGAEINDDHTLIEDLGFDSLNMVILLVNIEEALGIMLDEADMNPYDLITVRDVLNLVEKYGGI